MKCLSPINVANKFPGLRDSLGRYLVPCGKCEACLHNKAREWFVRLKFEQKYSTYCWFVTLTYRDDCLPDNFDVNKRDIILFHKRLRKALSSSSQPFRYFLCSEYGPNPENGWLLRPHYHAIYYNLVPEDLPLLEKVWNKGFVDIKPIADGCLQYVAGYQLEKLFVPAGHAPLFNLMSKGLGSCYLSENALFHQDTRFAYVPFHGRKLPLPRYYKERLFNSGERLHLSKLYAKQASDAEDKKLADLGGDFHALEVYKYEVRSQFIREQRKKHKKKKNC